MPLVAKYEERHHGGYWALKVRQTMLFRGLYPNPMGFKASQAFIAGLLPGLLTGIWMNNPSLWYVIVGNSLVGAAGLTAFVRRYPSRRKIEQLKQRGLIARRDSYAFRKLEEALAKLHIRVTDMNDVYDHDVAMVFIARYLKSVAPWTQVIDSGALENGDETCKAQLRQLKWQVKTAAEAAAQLIKEALDQRELRRQAIAADQRAQARAIESAKTEIAAAQASGMATVLLTSAPHKEI